MTGVQTSARPSWGGLSFESRTLWYPHNLPVEILAGAGIFVAFGLLAFFLATWVRSSRMSCDPVRAIFFALLVFSFANALVSSDIDGARLLVVMAFAAWVSSDSIFSSNENETIGRVKFGERASRVVRNDLREEKLCE